ncbi:chemotaxis protein CheB [Desulfonema limicola]|nr:chemotaxis protein CheB [Desulfonema limicola]
MNLQDESKQPAGQYSAIVIGVSAGGMDALNIILSLLPKDFPVPIMIVQHISPVSDNYLVKFLDNACRIKVKEAGEKIKPEQGTAYIAPPNYHLLVETDKSLSLSVDEKVNFARPSVDVLFETAADAYGKNLIGIILTGANKDGSMGLKKIKKYKGLTIVQSPETAAADEMPKSAIAAVDVDFILPLNSIASFLCKIFGKKPINKTSININHMKND